MKNLLAIVAICAAACGSALVAQETPASPRPPYTSLEMRMRIAGRTVTCSLADGTERHMNQTVTVDGVTYRCAVVFDENLRPTGVAWTQVLPQP